MAKTQSEEIREQLKQLRIQIFNCLSFQVGQTAAKYTTQSAGLIEVDLIKSDVANGVGDGGSEFVRGVGIGPGGLFLVVVNMDADTVDTWMNTALDTVPTDVLLEVLVQLEKLEA